MFCRMLSDSMRSYMFPTSSKGTTLLLFQNEKDRKGTRAFCGSGNFPVFNFQMSSFCLWTLSWGHRETHQVLLHWMCYLPKGKRAPLPCRESAIIPCRQLLL